jgi:hypothetical protein
MGFNNWEHFLCAPGSSGGNGPGPSEQLFTNTANAIIANGLDKLGYTYMNIDDCWMLHSRDANNNLQADSSRFPDGIPWLANYMHTRGLKLGTYEDVGAYTCGGFPGIANYYQQDANLLASWGIDYLKVDGCYHASTASSTIAQYQSMSTALKNSGRGIVYSESAPAYYQGTSDWYTVIAAMPTYGNLWREGGDIATYSAGQSDRWWSVVGNYSYNVGLTRYAGPGHWNDPDMLIIGDGDLTNAEEKSQMSLWSEMAAPLLIGTDLTTISASSLAVLKNADVIAVDQDSLGTQATRVATQNISGNSVDILTRPLANGDRAVVYFNKGSSAVSVSNTIQTLGYTGGTGCSFTAKDLWAGTSSQVTTSLSASSVASHGVAMYRISPASSNASSCQAPFFPVTSQVPHTNWSLKYVDSQQSGNAAINAFDDDSSSIWHTAWSSSTGASTTALPHEIQINLGGEYNLNGFSELPRQDGGTNGRIGQYEFYTSEDGTNWGSPVATGTFPDNANLQSASFTTVQAHYIRLRALSVTASSGPNYTSLAELNVTGNIARSGWSLKYADSQETYAENGAATNAFDGSNNTIWHTAYSTTDGGIAPIPHEIQINLGSEHVVSSFTELPRQDGGVNGRIGQYEFYTSEDGTNWGGPVATGTFPDSASLQGAGFSPVQAHYIRLRVLSATASSGPNFTSLAELNVQGQ